MMMVNKCKTGTEHISAPLARVLNALAEAAKPGNNPAQVEARKRLKALLKEAQ